MLDAILNDRSAEALKAWAVIEGDPTESFTACCGIAEVVAGYVFGPTPAPIGSRFAVELYAPPNATAEQRAALHAVGAFTCAVANDDIEGAHLLFQSFSPQEFKSFARHLLMAATSATAGTN